VPDHATGDPSTGKTERDLGSPLEMVPGEVAMDKTILVPVDGSPLAERALPYAHVFARAAGAGVLLVQAVPPSAELDGVEVGSARTRQAAHDYLRDLASRQPRPDRVNTKVVAGEAADALIAEIGATQPELVVMSTHGRSGLGRWIYGSVADALMRRADAPILLVPAACSAVWPGDRAPRILVPLDGSELAEGALELVEPWASAFQAEITVLRAVEPRAMAATDPAALLWLDPTAEQEEARSYVAEVVKKLQSAGYACRGSDAYGFAVPTILDTAHAEAADVIALATHGSGGLTRLLMGSVATGVVQRACVPVLLKHPVEARPVHEVVAWTAPASA
jgi:nucleotide-binding universal stress UspA family protein